MRQMFPNCITFKSRTGTESIRTGSGPGTFNTLRTGTGTGTFILINTVSETNQNF